ncbi:MAG: SPFH domain-containing protein [Planctomycetota bacterium]|nr:MAG: SPFH domain-containing protein [Planctomycetota bacterium]
MSERPASNELTFNARSGWLILPCIPLYWAALITYGVQNGLFSDQHPAFLISFFASIPLTITILCGFFLVNPNMSRVLVLFGRYRGTVRTPGFYWTCPFTMKHEISLRVHNLSSETIKVNDLVGNPIEIGAVVVWQVRDTAQARFDVEDYFEYVDVQIETAIRHLAKTHPYDENVSDSDVPSLRGDTAETAQELLNELQSRLDRAGIEVLEARISHLAYAPEIASAMLQRQQASAVIAARTKIVEGAVHMVEDALTQLSERGVVELDAERRATLVGNLLVVLCGNAHAQPVVNVGGLYN